MIVISEGETNNTDVKFAIGSEKIEALSLIDTLGVSYNGW